MNTFCQKIKSSFARNWWKVFREAFLFVNVFLMLFPLAFMVLSATKTNEEFLMTPFSLPSDFPGTMLNNLQYVISGKILFPELGGEYIEVEIFTPFFTMLKNSMILTVLSLAGMIIIATMFGYALGTKKFKGKGFMMFFLLIIQTVPFFGYIMPLRLVADALNIVDKLLGVVPVYIAVSLPMAIILFQGYFSSFPKEVEEAAMIDGCNEFQKFVRIIVPVSAGMIASLAVINFMGYWNEYAIANLLLGSKLELRTINMGVMVSNSQVGVTYYYYTFMLLVLSALPNFIFFTVFQKRIVGGMTLGAVKG
ncbi:MAG: carbohydrate ABC transporter permease [Christensenellales bacterium]